MRAIRALFSFDIVNALRDNMVIYILIAPLLLAGALRVVVPTLEGTAITIAVEDRLATDEYPAPSFIERLQRYGTVERFDSADAVRARVAATDDVAGVIWSRSAAGSPPRPSIVLEGNEGPEAAVLMEAVLASAIADSPVGRYTVTTRGSRSPLREYGSAVLMMLATLIGGLAVAFAMIDEKEQKVNRAFATSPMTRVSYVLARGLLAAILGAFVAAITHLILAQPGQSVAAFALALGSSLILPLVVALLVGGIAHNQIQAVAVLKIVMMVYLTIPLTSIIVPQRWHWLYAPLPNYWMFRVFESVYVRGASAGDLTLEAVATLLTSLVVAAALGVLTTRSLRPRLGHIDKRVNAAT